MSLRSKTRGGQGAGSELEGVVLTRKCSEGLKPLGGSEAHRSRFVSRLGLTCCCRLVIGLLAVILDLGGAVSRCADGLRAHTGPAGGLTAAHSYRKAAAIEPSTDVPAGGPGADSSPWLYLAGPAQCFFKTI